MAMDAHRACSSSLLLPIWLCSCWLRLCITSLAAFAWEWAMLLLSTSLLRSLIIRLALSDAVRASLSCAWVFLCCAARALFFWAKVLVTCLWSVTSVFRAEEMLSSCSAILAPEVCSCCVRCCSSHSAALSMPASCWEDIAASCMASIRSASASMPSRSRTSSRTCLSKSLRASRCCLSLLKSSLHSLSSSRCRSTRRSSTILRSRARSGDPEARPPSPLSPPRSLSTPWLLRRGLRTLENLTSGPLEGCKLPCSPSALYPWCRRGEWGQGWLCCCP
mmetsp:Transcript_15371/g.40529  ORF Transcript_15371/g.40529 Transcript_15371/m.40529 type:complete len:277 (+) Transcript_15371:1403-2233(+)